MTARHASYLIAAMALALAAVWPGRVGAAEPERTTLSMQPALPGLGNTVVLSARLAGADGRPRAGQRITFYMKVDLLGASKASLGNAVTDVSGVARVAFRVTRNESDTFTAHFAGTSELAAADAAPVAFDLALTEPVTKATPPPRELNVVGRWVPWTALAAGIGVWVALVTVMARVVVFVPAAARADGVTEQ